MDLGGNFCHAIEECRSHGTGLLERRAVDRTSATDAQAPHDILQQLNTGAHLIRCVCVREEVVSAVEIIGISVGRTLRFRLTSWSGIPPAILARASSHPHAGKLGAAMGDPWSRRRCRTLAP